MDMTISTDSYSVTQDGWMTSPTQWTWVWASSRRWWRTRKPGMLRSVGSQRVGHEWATEQQEDVDWIVSWTCPFYYIYIYIYIIPFYYNVAMLRVALKNKIFISSHHLYIFMKGCRHITIIWTFIILVT